MSVTYTNNASLGLPVVGNSLNVWGTELNTALTLLDKIILSQNFAEGTHSGLNFYYGNGRVNNTNVASGNIALTNNTTNYVEVSISGTVSKNTTGFSDGQIPLYQVTTSSGAITVITDKRSYMTANALFTLINNIATTTKSVKTGDNVQIGSNTNLNTSSTKAELMQNSDITGNYISTDEASKILQENGIIKLLVAISGTSGNAISWLNGLILDNSRNILVNNASAETGAQGALTIKKGTSEPVTNTNDQISLYATSTGGLGIQSQDTITNLVYPVKINTVSKYLHARDSAQSPLQAFISSSIVVSNTTTETDLMNFTLTGRATPNPQMIHVKLHTNLTTAVAAHTATIRFYIGSNVTSIVNPTAATFTDSKGWVNFYCYIKATNSISVATRASYGGSTFTGAGDATVDMTTNQTIKVTIQWNTANVGSIFTAYAGVCEVKN